MRSVLSADYGSPSTFESNYRAALASSEETLGVANKTRFEVGILLRVFCLEPTSGWLKS